MKRLAIFLPGGVALRDHGVHSPTLWNLISNLSTLFDTTVYSLRSSENSPLESKCGRATVKYVRAFLKDSFLHKLAAFYSAFRIDHTRNAFNMIHGFWAIPCGLLAVAFGRAFHIPSIVTLLGGETANLPSIPYGNMSNLPSRFLTLWACRNASTLILLTKYQMRQLRERGLSRRDLVVIPFGADRRLFYPRPRLSLSPPFRFLHVANLTQVKDQETLLHAFSETSKKLKCRLRIIGPDYLGGKLQRLSERLGLDGLVEFRGLMENRDLPREYRSAHMLLHTSLHEAQGVVVAEAAACGLIAAGTNVGLLSDLADGEDNTVDPGNHQELSEKIIRILRNPEHVRRLRSKLLQWASVHDMRWTIRQYQHVYLTLPSKKLR